MINLKGNDKLTIISGLETLLSSGIPISEAISSLLKESRGSSKKVLEILKEDVNEGKTISYSLGKIPGAFDPVTISLIKASEESGNLEKTLKDIKVNLAEEIEFNNKVKTALTYPLTIFVVFTAVLILILTFVVPKIASIFSKLRITLPFATKVLIFLSNIVLNYSLYILIFVIILSILSYFLYKYRKQALLNFFYSLPVISKISTEIDLARFTHNISILLKSGIPIVQSLELTKEIVNQRRIAKMIASSIDEISKGNKLSDGFENYRDVVPQTMIRITEAGERGGKLEESMSELSGYFKGRVDGALKTATTLIEPILLVIVGLLVGGMMLAIISPIYGLIGQIRGR